MPITKTSTVQHFIAEALVRMDQRTHLPIGMSGSFVRTIDGVPEDIIPFEMSAQDLAAFLGGATDPTLARGDDLTLAIYRWAVAAGVVQGEVS